MPRTNAEAITDLTDGQVEILIDAREVLDTLPPIVRLEDPSGSLVPVQLPVGALRSLLTTIVRVHETSRTDPRHAQQPEEGRPQP